MPVPSTISRAMFGASGICTTAKHQLFDKLRIDTAARQQLAHRRFP